MTTTRERVDAIDAEACRLNPSWRPLDDAAKAAMADRIDAAPPITDDQARRISRLLAGRPNGSAGGAPC